MAYNTVSSTDLIRQISLRISRDQIILIFVNIVWLRIMMGVAHYHILWKTVSWSTITDLYVKIFS